VCVEPLCLALILSLQKYVAISMCVEVTMMAMLVI